MRLLSLSVLALLPGLGLTTLAQDESTVITTPQPFSVALSGGTQGLGGSIGYRVSPHLGFRLQGAVLGYEQTDHWHCGRSRLQLNGNNAGLLMDIYPFGGNFYLTAGLCLSETNMRYKHNYTKSTGGELNIRIGQLDCILTQNNSAAISARYDWNHIQPYIGIGYSGSIENYEHFYYAIDLGLNYIGNGKYRVSHRGNLRYPDANNLRHNITDDQLKVAIRQEERSFFKIADKLHFYPVLQLSVGLRF